MFAFNKLDKPAGVYPRLNPNYVVQDEPDFVTVKSGWMEKKGQFGGGRKKRFFVLTTEMKLDYLKKMNVELKKARLIYTQWIIQEYLKVIH